MRKSEGIAPSARSAKTAPSKPARSRAGLWIAALLLIALGAGGVWLASRGRAKPSEPPKTRDLPPSLASARLVRMDGAGGEGRTETERPTASAAAPAQASRTEPMRPPEPEAAPAAPIAAARAPAPAAPVGAPRVTAFQWGGTGDDEIADLAARPDGRLVIVGRTDSEDAVPAPARPAKKLLDAQSGANRGFVAELSADGARLNWMSLFGSDLLEPKRVALAPDGSIYIGGKAGARLPAVAGNEAGDFSKTSTAVVKVAADGSRVLWTRAGGPNQDALTGIAVDAQGRVIWTAGTRGRGEAAYVIRRNADGSESPFAGRPAGRTWAIALHPSAEDLSEPGQYFAFYKKAHQQPGGYDYDGPGGWAPISFSLHGLRQGGQVVVLPNGDLIISGTLQYDFREQGKKSFPAFDLFLARYTADGRLLWSTNLYQPNDSVHTPDQKAVDLAYSPASDDVYVLAKQHGSNVYRFKGDLVGDTGNLMIGWLGQVNARTGALKAGYYFHHSRNTGYDERGIAKSPPYPKLSGNDLNRVAVDARGRVFVAGNAGAKAWTTPGAWRHWPAEQAGGGNGALYVFAPDLSRPLYATMIRGEEGGKSGLSGLAVADAGVWVGGHNAGRGFPTPERPAWSAAEPVGGKDFALARLVFP